MPPADEIASQYHYEIERRQIRSLGELGRLLIRRGDLEAVERFLAEHGATLAELERQEQ
jgi:hypothetical protein